MQWQNKDLVVRPSPDFNQEPLDPQIIITFIETGAHSPVSWGSLPSLKNSRHQETEQQTAQKFENLLKEMKDVIKDVMSYEEITEAKESFEETSMSEDVSELKEKTRGLQKINKVLLKNLFGTLDLEREQNAEKQEMMLEDQNYKNTVQGFARDLANCSLGKRALNETQPSKDKAQKRFPHVQEENIKLRNNMEQLLQEAEHWSVQHCELSELIKSYQKSQKDLTETVKNNGVIFQTQPDNDVLAEYELEEQVRRLKHDTYALQLTAALLENEC
ncbi:hypothetical protein MC885_014802 [Smutsia gigantea]|nr:hypothetical protein MC885_014802 [Smutsia gigantea]